jgi:hypothetical protein
MKSGFILITINWNHIYKEMTAQGHSKATSTLINIFVVLYSTQICACVNKFISVWTRVPHMNKHKIFVTFNAHDPFIIGFFLKTSKRFAPKHSNSLDVSVNVQRFWWMFMLPHARVDHRRTAHNVNFYVARTFTLRQKIVHWIFTFHSQQKYLLMWTRLYIRCLLLWKLGTSKSQCQWET